MKTTSYEISKKLAEIGFKAETEKAFDNEGTLISCHKKICILREKSSNPKIYGIPAYDLETILEALPKHHDFFSRGVGKYELLIRYHENKAFIGYQNFDGFDKLLTLEQEKNESLADIAARLLILLHNKGLINFKENK
jgi:hypothetical protein